MLAVWQPVLDDPEDSARVAALAKGMPPACRAPVREGAEAAPESMLPAEEVLLSFLERLVDQAVRDWARQTSRVDQPDLGRGASRLGLDLSAAWWRALWSDKRALDVPSYRQEVTRFYQAWQSWTYRAPTGGGCRLSALLSAGAARVRAVIRDVSSSPTGRCATFCRPRTTPACWCRRRKCGASAADVLSYLNHRFDQPQEKLLAGLGMAARLCPAIQRSLRHECPEAANADGARGLYLFARDGPPAGGCGLWRVWCRPGGTSPIRVLRVRARLHASPDGQGSGILGHGFAGHLRLGTGAGRRAADAAKSSNGSRHSRRPWCRCAAAGCCSSPIRWRRPSPSGKSSESRASCRCAMPWAWRWAPGRRSTAWRSARLSSTMAGRADRTR